MMWLPVGMAFNTLHESAATPRARRDAPLEHQVPRCSHTTIVAAHTRRGLVLPHRLPATGPGARSSRHQLFLARDGQEALSAEGRPSAQIIRIVTNRPA